MLQWYRLPNASSCDTSWAFFPRMRRMSESVVREAYTLIFPRRNELMENRFTKIMATGSLERVVGALPAFMCGHLFQ